MGKDKVLNLKPKTKKILFGVPLTLLVLLVADYWLYGVWGQAGPAPTAPMKNAIWARYTWYFGEKSRDETEAFADTMQRHGVSEAYFHVRYIKADGTLKFRYPDRAKKLNQDLKRLYPDLKRIAWIYAGHDKLGDVDLSKPDIRQKLAEEAAWLVTECGFEGVQWDYEICPDGDRKFLDLLERTRKTLPKRAELGAATPMWFPVSGVGWSTDYYAEVAKRCDQIAVMCYDSGFYFPRAYTWLVERQARILPPVVKSANPRCEIILGLPTYEEGPPSHNSHAESLRFALWGARKGLATTEKPFDGVALFAEYTTEAEEWRTFADLWVPSADGEGSSLRRSR